MFDFRGIGQEEKRADDWWLAAGKKNEFVRTVTKLNLMRFTGYLTALIYPQQLLLH